MLGTEFLLAYLLAPPFRPNFFIKAATLYDVAKFLYKIAFSLT